MIINARKITLFTSWA